MRSKRLLFGLSAVAVLGAAGLLWRNLAAPPLSQTPVTEVAAPAVAPASNPTALPAEPPTPAAPPPSRTARPPSNPPPRTQPTRPASTSIRIIRRPVVSSAFRSVGYDAANRVLEVEFLRGAVYRYYNVPPSVYEDFINAPSLGRYYNWYIKGRYRSQRVY